MKYRFSQVTFLLSIVLSPLVIGLITMYRFLGQFFSSSPQEPTIVVFQHDVPHLRFLLDIGLVTQFVMVHSSFTAQALKRMLQDTRLTPMYRAFYLIFSFLSLEVLFIVDSSHKLDLDVFLAPTGSNVDCTTPFSNPFCPLLWWSSNVAGRNLSLLPKGHVRVTRMNG